jgi:hypothetical protein
MRAPEAWVVLPLLAAWAMIVDIPLFMLDGSDDGFYTEFANLWTKGSPPTSALSTSKRQASSRFSLWRSLCSAPRLRH